MALSVSVVAGGDRVEMPDDEILIPCTDSDLAALEVAQNFGIPILVVAPSEKGLDSARCELGWVEKLSADPGTR